MDSCAVSTLCPDAIASADVWGWQQAGPLHRAERADTARMGAARRAAFAAGRHCARQALGYLGMKDVAVARSEMGLPAWPQNTVGSITHTHGYAAAAVAHADDCRALGIDAETIGRLKPKLWPRVFTEAEQRWLRALDSKHRDMYATVIFSAKEAFYKCQYPITGRFLSFQDAEIELEGATFRVHCSKLENFNLHGRFCVVNRKALTVAYVYPED